MKVGTARSKRDRQIWVRLTHEEYERLRNFADKTGAATISNCARDAVRRATEVLADADSASGLSGQGTWTLESLVQKRPRAGPGTRARTSRDCTITVRLTNEEHEKLCLLCMATQARSISDCARQAVCQAMADSDLIQDVSIIGRMDTLEQELASVRRELARVLTLVEPVPSATQALGRPEKAASAAVGRGS